MEKQVYNLLNMCQEMLDKAVVSCFNEESTLLQVVPIQKVTGHAVAYNRVMNGFTVQKRALGEDITTEQEMETVKVVEPLEISANRVKVDRGLVLMSGDDVRAIETEVQSKAMGRQLHLDILTKLKADAGIKIVPVGAIPTADEVAEAMDSMKFVDGKMMMFTNAKTNRAIQKEAIANGYSYGHIDAFGKRMYNFNGVPVDVTNDLADGEVIVAYLDVAEGVSLATNGGVRTIDLGMNDVFYRTDIEFIGIPVVKNSNAVAYINKPVTARETKKK